MADLSWVWVRVDEGSFLLADNDGIEPDLLDFTTGLIGATTKGAMICAGINAGNVKVAVESSHDRPQANGLDEWDDVAEASVFTPRGSLRVVGTLSDAPQELPVLSRAGSGWYRVRVHASGRDIAHDQVNAESDERYRILCWPAPPTTPLILRATDYAGRSLRSSATLAFEAPEPHDRRSTFERKLHNNLSRMQPRTFGSEQPMLKPDDHVGPTKRRRVLPDVRRYEGDDDSRAES